jgi:hypothetical protein
MSLLEKLTDLGDHLIAGEVPPPADLPKVLAAVVHYLDTGGSCEPPERAPSATVQRQLTEDQAEIARLRAQVDKLSQAQAPAQASPATFAPPTPPAPPLPPTPAPPAGGQGAASDAPQPPAELA